MLVTGGTGGLGALVAERLVTEHGVRSLLLLSRSGPAAAGAAELVDRLTGLGAEVEVAACDVADRAALATAIGGRQLSGVVHAAGVTADAALAGLTAEQVAAAFGPKVDAAWHLHELTVGQDLAAFVLFSSLAGLVGNAGQGSYAAANGFVDGLAAHRHAARPAGDLGRLGPVGRDDRDDRPARRGRPGPADPVRGGAADRRARPGPVRPGTAHARRMPVFAGAAWDSAGLRKRAESGQLAPVLRSLTRAPRRASSATAEPAGNLASRLAALDPETGRQRVLDLIRDQVASVLAHGDSASGAGGSDLLPARLRLADRGRAAQPARRRHRIAAAGHVGLRLPDRDQPGRVHLFHASRRHRHRRTRRCRPAWTRSNSRWLEHDETARSRVIAVLHSALARLEGDAEFHAEASAEVSASLSDASDDEIFAFIDTQL